MPYSLIKPCGYVLFCESDSYIPIGVDNHGYSQYHLFHDLSIFVALLTSPWWAVTPYLDGYSYTLGWSVGIME